MTFKGEQRGGYIIGQRITGGHAFAQPAKQGVQEYTPVPDMTKAPQ
jgi:hypothetical protein